MPTRIRYLEAVQDFQKSISLSPNEVMPHLYLATAWMAQYKPSAESSEKARNAEAEFDTVLQLDPQNFTAMQSLALLSYHESKGMTNEAEKLRKLDEAASRYGKVLALDPRNKEAYFSLCLIDWVKWYPKVVPAHNVRDLLTRFASLMEEGTAYLARRSQHDDDMTYRDMLIKESADTPEEYRPDLKAAATLWVQKAIRAKVATEWSAIGKDGRVIDLRLVSGHPLLAVESTQPTGIQTDSSEWRTG